MRGEQTRAGLSGIQEVYLAKLGQRAFSIIMCIFLGGFALLWAGAHLYPALQG